jgi:hypothetical protein
VRKKHHDQQEPVMPHLFPKELRKIKRTPRTPAKAQQAGDHDG